MMKCAQFITTTENYLELLLYYITTLHSIRVKRGKKSHVLASSVVVVVVDIEFAGFFLEFQTISLAK